VHYIYIYQNILNNKIYVGQTNNIKVRHYNHLYKSKNCPEWYFDYALKKYGADNFTFFTIEEWETQDEADTAENFWIQYFQTTNSSIGYNLKTGGGVATFTPEVRKRMSLAHLGKSLSEEVKDKISLSLTGIERGPMSDEHKSKVSASKTGIPLSIEHILKLSGENHHHFDKTFSDDHKNKISEGLKENTNASGSKRSEESLLRMSESHKGQKVSEIIKKKISVSKSKLSEKQKQDIMIDTRTHQEIAVCYRVSRPTITRIKGKK
jgi:group I intron endonuclease